MLFICLISRLKFLAAIGFILMNNRSTPECRIVNIHLLLKIITWWLLFYVNSPLCLLISTNRCDLFVIPSHTSSGSSVFSALQEAKIGAIHVQVYGFVCVKVYFVLQFYNRGAIPFIYNLTHTGN